MSEIEEVGTTTVDDHAGMSAVDAVVSSGAGRTEKIALLGLPVQQIVGSIHAQSFPQVDEHPGMSFPLKYEWTFARALPNSIYFPMVSPGVQVGTVGVINGFVIALIIVPQPPAAA